MPQNLSYKGSSLSHHREVESFFKLLPVATFIFDLKTGRIVEANTQAEITLGFSRDELIGLRPTDLSPEFQSDGRRSETVVQEKLEKFHESDGDTFFWQHKHKDGRLVPSTVQVSKLAMLGRDRYISFVTEVTKQGNLFHHLIELKHILNSIGNPIALVGRDFTYQYVNSAFESVINIPAEEIIGLSVGELVGKEIFESQVRQHYEDCFNGKDVSFQMLFETEEAGQRMFDIRYYPFRDLGGEILAAVSSIRDITELFDAQNALSRAAELDNVLTGISSLFLDVTIEDFDEKITDSLKRLGEYLVLDRCSFGHLTEDKKEMIVTHVWNKFKIPNAQQSYRIDDYAWLLSPFRTGEPLLWHHSEGMPNCSKNERGLLKQSGMQAFAGIPVSVDGNLVSCLGFSRISCPDNWDLTTTDRFSLIASMFGQLIKRKQSDLELHNAFVEIKNLKELLENENKYLLEELKSLSAGNEIIGESTALKDCLLEAEHVAREQTSVLILGETGTGKELLAQAIHNMSPRGRRTMVKVNCAALPANLIESELFGREKGAYTGAMTRQQGRFQQANGSTIFLDEIGDLPLELQSKLLRVLQEGSFEMLGSTKLIKVDVRIIAATNHDLKQLVEEGLFRKDLYYRINVFPITVPPLVDRREDIPLLCYYFVDEFNRSMGKSITKIHARDLETLKISEWPGNVRELRNIIERSMILSSGTELQIRKALRREILNDRDEATAGETLADVERSHILKILESTGWRVSGNNCAAEILGLKPTTLEARMRKLDIRRPA